MFSEEDTMRAKHVTPLDDSDFTWVRSPEDDSVRSTWRPPLFATAVMILSAILLTSPEGAVLEKTIWIANSTKKLWSVGNKSAGTNSVGHGGVSIDATNSTIQNVQIVNNGGQVNVSPQKR